MNSHRLSLSLALALLASPTAAQGAPLPSSYAISAFDAPGSTTGAAAAALGVPDYAFVNDAGLGFGGSNADVFDVGESTTLAFPFALRNVPDQADLIVSAFVGGAGATDSALVGIEVSSDGVGFVALTPFDTATGRTSYPLSWERDFEGVKHFAVDFEGQDLVTHVRLTNLGGTGEGLRLDAVEGLHPVVAGTHAFEIRFECYRGPAVERLLVRIKNLAAPGTGPGIHELRIDKPDGRALEETWTTLHAPDGDFVCVEGCIRDNGPPIPFSRHVWTAGGSNGGPGNPLSNNGLAETPRGLGLPPGHAAGHSRWRNFDLDTPGSTFLAGFDFTITFTDGKQHSFSYDTDVIGQGVAGSLYQKYQYFTSSPSVSGPHDTQYYEFVGDL